MRIGINLIQYTDFHGVEAYAKNLLQAIFDLNKDDEFILFTNQKSSKIFDFKGSNIQIIEKKFSKLSKLNLILYQQINFLFILKKEKIDLLYCPTIAAPIFYKNKLITIHDCAAKRFKEEAGIISRIYLFFAYMSAKYFSVKILTVSDFSKKELENIYKIKTQDIEIISGATAALPEVDNDFIRNVKEKYKIDSPYFIYVGNIYPRKNLFRVLEAFSIFLSDHPNFNLVLAGRINDNGALKDKIKELKIEKNIIQTGAVTEEEKVALFKSSEGHIFLSLYEGFGLSVLEANGLGVPVLASNFSPMTDVGGDAALFIDPYKISEIISGMKKIAFDENLRKKLEKNGYKNIKRFSWTESAKKLNEVLKNTYRKK